MKGLFTILLFISYFPVVSQEELNCEDTLAFHDGKSWAYYTLQSLPGPYYDKDGNTQYYPQFKFYVCDNYSETTQEPVHQIYKELLSIDSISVVSCNFHIGLGCYGEGVRFVYDSVLVANGFNEKYFEKQYRKARRAYKKRNRKP